LTPPLNVVWTDTIRFNANQSLLQFKQFGKSTNSESYRLTEHIQITKLAGKLMAAQILGFNVF
jgi:hypothetical protein